MFGRCRHEGAGVVEFFLRLFQQGHQLFDLAEVLRFLRQVVQFIQRGVEGLQLGPLGLTISAFDFPSSAFDSVQLCRQLRNVPGADLLADNVAVDPAGAAVVSAPIPSHFCYL